MTAPTAPTASTWSPTGSAAPRAVRAAVAVFAILAVVSTFGLIMFGTVWSDDPLGSGLVFGVVALVAVLTAAAGLPRLLRGDRTGWLLTTGWAVAFTYWSVYKVFAMPEFESWPFLLGGLVLCALLLSPSARHHARIAD